MVRLGRAVPAGEPAGNVLLSGREHGDDERPGPLDQAGLHLCKLQGLQGPVGLQHHQLVQLISRGLVDFCRPHAHGGILRLEKEKLVRVYQNLLRNS